MIYGIGTDVIEVSRIKKQIEGDIGFKEKIFSAKEIEYCDPRRHKEQNYAARYAAKEAFFKALGTGWRFGMEFKEVEILNDELGKPEIFLSGKAKDYFDGKGLKRIHTTMSHIKESATATVILEK
jgi:holo-[acyl-carrier protein] synthase